SQPRMDRSQQSEFARQVPGARVSNELKAATQPSKKGPAAAKSASRRGQSSLAAVHRTSAPALPRRGRALARVAAPTRADRASRKSRKGRKDKKTSGRKPSPAPLCKSRCD